MARLFVRFGVALAALVFSAQMACAQLVTAPTYKTPSGTVAAALGIVCINPDLSSCTFGGGGGGVTANASAGPTAITAGSGKALNMGLFSNLFVTPVTPGGAVVDLSGPSGIFGVDGATVASLTNPVPGRTQAVSTGGASSLHAVVANNTTSVAIDASPGTLYGVQVFNNSAVIAYEKLYDATQGTTTCGSGTPKKVIMIPANTSGAGASISFGAAGLAFTTAITRCVTTGIADNDTGAPAASTYIVEADFK